MKNQSRPSARRPASVMRTTATSIFCLPATVCSALALARPARTSSTIRRDGETMREHDRLGRAIARRDEQLERSAAIGLGRAFARAVAGTGGIKHGFT